MSTSIDTDVDLILPYRPWSQVRPVPTRIHHSSDPDHNLWRSFWARSSSLVVVRLTTGLREYLREPQGTPWATVQTLNLEEDQRWYRR